MNTSWECDWRAIGDQGTVTWDGGDAFAAQVVAKTGGFRSEWADARIPPLDPADRTGGHGGQIADFCDCVRTGRVPETVAGDNIRSLAMVFGAIESAGEGCEVPVAW
jgi:predicted dehydrogenase